MGVKGITVIKLFSFFFFRFFFVFSRTYNEDKNAFGSNVRNKPYTHNGHQKGTYKSFKKKTNKQTKKNNKKTHPFDKKCGNVLIGFSFYM